MVQKSGEKTTWDVSKLIKWDKLPTSTSAGFLNHQQYHCIKVLLYIHICRVYCISTLLLNCIWTNVADVTSWIWKQYAIPTTFNCVHIPKGSFRSSRGCFLRVDWVHLADEPCRWGCQHIVSFRNHSWSFKIKCFKVKKPLPSEVFIWNSRSVSPEFVCIKCESLTSRSITDVAPLEFPKVPAIAPHAPGACNDGSSVQHVYEDLRISANGS